MTYILGLQLGKTNRLELAIDLKEDCALCEIEALVGHCESSEENR